ncbi:MAG: hypothetical protein EA417_08880 [Gammaproteobacteria bacterium]|nr:MAG: hypothetical protein EA417_08880 [Gammaproteobacteria bacterium]
MSDLHIDDFCKDIALVLNQLYLTFPRKSTLFVEDISGPDEPDEYGLHTARHMSCLGAILWLAEEGYIRFEDTIRQEAVDQAVLGGRMFSLLSAVAGQVTPFETDDFGNGIPNRMRERVREGFGNDVPSSVLLNQRSHINRLRLALGSQSSERIRAVVLDVLERARG